MSLEEIQFKGTLAEYYYQEISIERLINILKKIDNDEVSVKTFDGIIKRIFGNDMELALIEVLAGELLITSNGQCNWSNINRLKNEGFDVFAGDRDDFGWLTGCIKTKKGILVYG